MYTIINYWICQAVTMFATTLVIPKLRITSIFGAFWIVMAIAFVNATVWDAALWFSLPESFTNQAVTLLLANGMIFWVLVKMLPGIEVDGLIPAIVAPVVFTVISLLIATYAKNLDWIALIKEILTMVIELKDELLQQMASGESNAYR